MASIFSLNPTNGFSRTRAVAYLRRLVGDSRHGPALLPGALILAWALCSPCLAKAQTQPTPEQKREPAPEPKAEKSWPEKLGPAEIKTGAGAVRLRFATQLLATELSEDQGDTHEGSFGVEPRRIRWYLKGRFFDDQLKFELQMNTTPKTIELLDYWGEWRFFEQLQVRLGQYKIPFTRYRLQSWSDSLLVDWAIVTKYLGAERQMGLMLNNGAAEPRFEYALGVFSGQNARKSHAIGPSIVYGEDKNLKSPSDLRDPGPLEEWHPELVARVAHNSPHAEPLIPSDSKRTGPRHVESLSVAWDANPTATADFSLRVSPEVMLKAYGMALILGGYAGVAKMTQSSDNKLAMLGALVEAAYRFNRFWEIAARFARVDIMRVYRKDASDRASGIIAAESDPDTQDALKSQYKSVGKVKADQEVTLGLTVYIVGSDLKWQTDISWLRKYRVDDDRNDYRARTQMQFAF